MKKKANKKMKATKITNSGRAAFIHQYRSKGLRQTEAIKAFHAEHPKLRVTPSLFARIWKRASKQARLEAREQLIVGTSTTNRNTTS